MPVMNTDEDSPLALMIIHGRILQAVMNIYVPVR